MKVATTTQPSPSTERAGDQRTATHLRWVFPGSLITPIFREQTLGRDESCDTVLPGREISRRHAQLRVDGPVAAIRDLDSRNGVYVNGLRCSDAPLAVSDVVRCGEWIAVVVAEAGDSAGYREIAPGWFGGATLFAAIQPARRTTDNFPVVIQGETGTGKEGVARAVHNWSGREGRFVAVNCATLPAQLAEAELFGHRKGAFTGADTASPGLFRAARGGSLFLDEILDLSLENQAKLLRVLEEHTVRAVGETHEVRIDVRVIAATQEPLASAVEDGRFRADLRARLEGLTVMLPPLRERREDVAPLFLNFLRPYDGQKTPEIEAKLVEALCIYDWPLNVRELELLARRLVSVHGQGVALKKAHLPEAMLARVAAQPPSADSTAGPGSGAKRIWRKTDDEAEYEAVLEGMRTHGSVDKVAKAMGVSRNRVYRVLSAHRKPTHGNSRRSP